MFVDGKQRRWLVTLSEGAEFHTHAGLVEHDKVIGEAPGVRLESTRGARYQVMRPTLEDTVVEMPRGAQVIYPKDLATMCMLADIGTGTRVFETGVGSGALSMAMLRWGADVTALEIREDFMNRATANVERHVGAEGRARFRVLAGDAYEAIPAGPFDAVMLDLPEPWRVIEHASRSLVPGGRIVAYTPSITQAVQVREALGHGWQGARTLEVLHRTWHIEGQSVRPDHRMVAHTAFLTAARWTGQVSTAR